MTGPDEVLDFIISFIAKRGYAPSIREIQTALSLSSPSRVQDRLVALRSEGRIDWEPGLPRTLRVLEKPCTS